MDSDERVVAYAEALVRLEDLKIQMRQLADEVWLTIYAPRD